jgi:plastocyanin
MKRVVMAVAAMSMLVAACGTDGGPATRQVLVDYSPDDYPTSVFGYFPRFVEAHPGDVIDFRQTWTGEPHTITLGTLTKPLGDTIKPLFLKHKELPDFIDTEQYGLPSIFPPNDDPNPQINQAAAQPCYLSDGPIPANGVGCPHEQPAFDGTQAYYNSGYIPFRGKKRDRFRVPLSASIKPGEYFYYCVLHGPGMGGFVEVKPKSETLRSNRGLHDPDLVAAVKAADAARKLARTKAFRLPDTDIQAGTFSYYVKQGSNFPSAINEFLPSSFHAKVGQRITWSFVNGPGHTVSFDVPPYLPAIVFKPDGRVELNQKTYDPQGGPGYPRDGREPPDDGAPVDAGNYDGSFFLSSGYPDGPMRYSVTFTKPGNYPYACLIHPLMLGRVIVSA